MEEEHTFVIGAISDVECDQSELDLSGLPNQIAEA